MHAYGGSIQIVKFKLCQYQRRASSPNLMLTKVSRSTVVLQYAVFGCCFSSQPFRPRVWPSYLSFIKVFEFVCLCSPKVLSRPGEDSSDSEESSSHSPSLPHSPVATPANSVAQTPPPPPSAAVAAAAIASAIAANTSPTGSKEESLPNSHG